MNAVFLSSGVNRYGQRNQMIRFDRLYFRLLDGTFVKQRCPRCEKVGKIGNLFIKLDEYNKPFIHCLQCSRSWNIDMSEIKPFTKKALFLS